MTTYRQEIIDRYRFPRHKAAMDMPDTQSEVVNSLCGDEIIFFLKLDAGKEKIADAKFMGEGCALTLASADLLCDHIIGKDLKSLETFDAEDMIALYGESPSPSRLKCVLLPYEALTMGFRTL